MLLEAEKSEFEDTFGAQGKKVLEPPTFLMASENKRYEEEKGQDIQDSIASDHSIESDDHYGRRQANSAAK